MAADLTEADVTIELTQDDIDRSSDKGIRTYPTVSFGDGALLYPSGPELGHAAVPATTLYLSVLGR
jgi:hypothetical protein